VKSGGVEQDSNEARDTEKDRARSQESQHGTSDAVPQRWAFEYLNGFSPCGRTVLDFVNGSATILFKNAGGSTS